MSVKQQVTQNSEVDERLAALMTNANAIRAIAQAVEGTIGPKGLDTMLVDQFGDVVITNDGVTILDMMDVNHPAARMLIKIAKAQQEEIGDGTTTATIMAGALVSEGVAQVLKGVPVAKVIEGLRIGVKKALSVLEAKTIQIKDIRDPLLKQVALVAGRENEDIAELVVQAAILMGQEKLRDPSFKLAEIIRAEEGAENQVVPGVIINKEPMNSEMPKKLGPVKVLVIDDALEPEEVEDEALATEAGFTRYLALQEEFRNNIKKIIEAGVNLILVDRGVDAAAEEFLTDHQVMVLQRVSNRELRRAGEHTGARLLKRTGLKKELAELEKYTGSAREAFLDEKLEHVRLLGGAGKAEATILVGASTEEVVGERERIAKDAASAIQAAVRGGIVPGGGSIELAIARHIEEARKDVRGMAAYGLDCVIAALKKPFSQIVLNAGFNPLEKLGDVMAAQAESGLDSLGIDCDTGEVKDMGQLGVFDPALVKKHALKAAGEVAEAILRIDTIIKKKETKPHNDVKGEDFV
ncbi:chaperonin [Thermanaerosceptrum fracticalcis]|uniref:Chaperonin n=1 Tax=Thermanaerosceptrum fracticalcis TaxID=1712410 RepID=A0A7G6E258_THEFR|nr:TCP-1/cpn60 chaperonin family protein [Thermanaerosceptrum fracticalcis]QNB46162.1 chaperonin [Thermanaerosceptrum fracticalcis]